MPDSIPRCRLSSLRLTVLLCSLLVPLSLFAQANSMRGAAQNIRLTIDYGDGVQKQIHLPFSQGMKVFDAMNAAQLHSHGIKYQCEHPTGDCMVIQIDDLTNEGPGADKRNWQYWVNGKYACFGINQVQLKASDRVLWKFVVEPPNPCHDGVREGGKSGEKK